MLDTSTYVSISLPSSSLTLEDSCKGAASGSLTSLGPAMTGISILDQKKYIFTSNTVGLSFALKLEQKAYATAFVMSCSIICDLGGLVVTPL